MKKFFLMMTAALALSLVSCNGNKDYKTEGQELSQQLDKVVEKNDTAATLQTDEQIRKMEQDIIASGDTAALGAFREAMKDARVRNAAFVVLSKIHNGMDREEAMKELIQDALSGDVNIQAVTSAIDVLLKADQANKGKESAEKSAKK